MISLEHLPLPICQGTAVCSECPRTDLALPAVSLPLCHRVWGDAWWPEVAAGTRYSSGMEMKGGVNDSGLLLCLSLVCNHLRNLRS